MNDYVRSQLIRAEIEADPVAYLERCYEFTLSLLEDDDVRMPAAAMKMLGTPVIVAESHSELVRALTLALEAAYRLGQG